MRSSNRLKNPRKMFLIIAKYEVLAKKETYHSFRGVIPMNSVRKWLTGNQEF